jgi:porphobilinogen deaminase
MEIAKLIRSAGEKSDDRIVVDKKQYLFEAELNEQLGNPNVDTCLHLIKMVPKYLLAYQMIRKVAMANNVTIEVKEDEEENKLVVAFNDMAVSEADFMTILKDSVKEDSVFKSFSSKIRKINLSAC